MSVAVTATAHGSGEGRCSHHYTERCRGGLHAVRVCWSCSWAGRQPPHQRLHQTTHLGAAPQNVTLTLMELPAAVEAATATSTGSPTTGAAVCTCRLTDGPAADAAAAAGALMDASASDSVWPAVPKSTRSGNTHKPCTVPDMLLPEGLPRVTSPALLIVVDTHPVLATDAPYACTLPGAPCVCQKPACLLLLSQLAWSNQAC